MRSPPACRPSIVAGLEPARIRPILDVALARFEHEQALRTELDQARTELKDRKTVERAMGLLMQRQGLSIAGLRAPAQDRDGQGPQAGRGWRSACSTSPTCWAEQLARRLLGLKQDQ